MTAKRAKLKFINVRAMLGYARHDGVANVDDYDAVMRNVTELEGELLKAIADRERLEGFRETVELALGRLK